MCCGSGRARIQYRQASSASSRRLTSDVRPTRAEPPSTAASQPADLVELRYLDSPAVRVRGLASGRTYEFSGENPVQHVEARDAYALLNTHYFRRA
jgi:hypothetical protein